METLVSLISGLPPVTPQNIYIYAAVGGFLPPLVWLTFFLQQDKKNPEPKRVIIGSFLFGVLSAVFAVPFQGFFLNTFPGAGLILGIVIFALIEELSKYFSVRFSALNDVANDEAIDPIIYMLTAAIGFAAMENTLYFIDYLNNFDLVNATLERGKRFFGSTLLHVLSSIFVGISLSLSHEKRKKWRPLLLPIGIVSATALHALFNIFVTGNSSQPVIMAFVLVWVVLIATLVGLEFVKDYVGRILKEREAQEKKEEGRIIMRYGNPFEAE